GLDRGGSARRRFEAVEPRPLQVDADQGAPAIERPLPGFERDEPPQGDELLARLLDAAQADAEGVGDPRRLDPSDRGALPGLDVEAAEEGPEDGGDQGRASASGQEAEDAARDRHQTPVVGNPVEEAAEAVAVGEGDALDRNREADGRFRPEEQP